MLQIKNIFEPLVRHEEILREKGACLGSVLRDFFEYDAEKYANNWSSIEETTGGGYSFYAEIKEPLSTVRAGEFKPPMKLEVSLLTGGVCAVDMSPCKPAEGETLIDAMSLYTNANIPFSVNSTPEESVIEILGKLAVSSINSSLQESLSSYLIDLKDRANKFKAEQDANTAYRV